MKQEETDMFRKITIITTLTLIALFLIGCGALTAQAGGRAPVSLAQSAEGVSSDTATLTVTGVGQARLNPDIAFIYIGVRTEGEDVSLAVDENSERTETVIDAMIGMGIAEKDVRTSNFSVYQMDQWDFQGTRTGSTFVVENSVFVTVRNLEEIGEVLSTAIESGANNINQISFDVEDRTAALADAREAAVENARAQAEELAALAGVELGAIHSISMYGGGGYPGPMFGMGGGGFAYEAAVADVPVMPGELTFSVDVNIVFEILQ
jgi:uncharacterized protein YggE